MLAGINAFAVPADGLQADVFLTRGSGRGRHAKLSAGSSLLLCRYLLRPVHHVPAADLSRGSGQAPVITDALNLLGSARRSQIAPRDRSMSRASGGSASSRSEYNLWKSKS